MTECLSSCGSENSPDSYFIFCWYMSSDNSILVKSAWRKIALPLQTNPLSEAYYKRQWIEKSIDFLGFYIIHKSQG